MEGMNESERELMGVIKPSAVLKGLNSSNLQRVDEQQMIKIRITVWRTLRPQLAMNYSQFLNVFNNYLQLIPGNALGPPGGPIPEEVVPNLYQLQFGENEPFSLITFGAAGFTDSGLYCQETKVVENPSHSFLKSCRKIANVLQKLKVWGDRFVRADVLLDMFHQGLAFGTQNVRRSDIWKNIHNLTADQLWTNGAPVVVTSWITERYLDDPEEIYLQVINADQDF